MGKRPQGGLSLVELMVAVTLGLLIIVGVLQLLASNLRANREVLVAARLDQELRTAADLTARELRRAGYWANSQKGVWTPGTSVEANPYAAQTGVPSASEVRFVYALDGNETVDDPEWYGFRLDGTVLQARRAGEENWLDVTDRRGTVVTQFNITPRVQELALGEYCVNPCPVGSTTCPPQVRVRHYDIVIAAALASDASVVRQVRESVRLRNDEVVGSCS